jgi:hypothetical protein
MASGEGFFVYFCVSPNRWLIASFLTFSACCARYTSSCWGFGTVMGLTLDPIAVTAFLGGYPVVVSGLGDFEVLAVSSDVGSAVAFPGVDFGGGLSVSCVLSFSHAESLPHVNRQGESQCRGSCRLGCDRFSLPSKCFLWWRRQTTFRRQWKR